MACGADEFKRFQEIDKFFSSGKKATVKELAKYFYNKQREFDFDVQSGFSDKVLYKVLTAMKEELGMPLSKDSENRYFYNSTKTLTKPGFLNREETGKTIRMVNSLLETIKDTPIYEEAENLCKNITKEAPLFDKYGKEVRSESKAAASRVIFLGAPASVIRDSIWSEIYKAMEGNYHISIKYVTPGHTEPVSRGVKPYQLIFDNGIWDLWGYDCVKQENFLYNLSRIKSIEIIQNADRFEYKEEFDFHNITPGTFGCFRDTDTNKMTSYKIRVKKGSYAENYASERVWGKNPFIEKDEKGTIISFENNQYLPILRWVLSWGPDAEPLEPPKLVEEWKRKIREMCKKI